MTPPTLGLAIFFLMTFGTCIFAESPPTVSPPAKDTSPPKIVVYKTVTDQGQQRPLRLFIFEPPDRSPPRPAIILFHSGGWDHGSPRNSYDMARRFARAGLVAICAEYRLIGEKGADNGNTVFESVRDARSAVRYLRSHASELGIDAKRIVAAGGSAGGHLALSTASFEGDSVDDPNDDLSISPKPRALVLFNPVVDTSPAGYGNQKLGGRWQELSPLHHVQAGLPPAIMFHGTADRVAPFVGAQRYTDATLAAGNICEFHPQEGAGHGDYRKEPVFTEVISLTLAFLERQNVLTASQVMAP